MFGSSSGFGLLSSSPFGSPSVFGQASGASNNPFATKAIGSTTPFGSQTGSSMFGCTSTGVFGATSPPFSSTMLPFGDFSSPPLGSSAPTFGSSVFHQKPAFGGFGSSPVERSSFGSSTSQPSFGGSIVSPSAPFGALSTPAFGVTPSFGATSSPAFGTSTFESTGSAFGASTTPAFGTGEAFRTSCTPAFGALPAFRASSIPSLSFGSSSAFGQSSSAFGSSSLFGSSTSPFRIRSSPFGAQSTAPAFGGPSFGHTSIGVLRGVSRTTPYTATTETDVTGTQPAGRLGSISGMPAYKDKCHEELRWEDYQRRGKGGPLSAGGLGFGSASSSPSPVANTPAFAQPSPNPFSSSISTNPFAPKPAFPVLGSSASTFTYSPFSASSSSGPFGSTSPPLFASSSTFGSSSSAPLFDSSSTPGVRSSPSLFNTAAQGSAPSFSSTLNFGNTQPSPLFTSTTPTFGQQPFPSFGQSEFAFRTTSTPSFGQTSTSNLPSLGFGVGLFLSTPSLVGQSTPSFSSPFQVTQPAQTSTGLGFSFGQTPAAGTGGISGSSILGQGNFGRLISSQSTAMAQEVPITNPFGTLPSTPQMSIGRSGAGSSIQYGISSMPIVDRSAPVKVSSLISPRYLSLRHARLPAKKYRPNYDASKVMFFTNDEETQIMPKADASFIPRENPRALVISPIEQRPLRASTRKSFPTGNASVPPQEDGINSEVHISTSNSNDTEVPITGQISDNDPVEAQVHQEHDRVYGFITEAPITGQISDNDPVEAQVHQEHNRVYGGHSVRREDAYMTVGGHRAGEAAIAYEHGADIEALMPKLRCSDYYTDPPIKELAAKGRAEPGFCHRIKDFVVGRHGYGSIRFFGLTDVRGLDLESLVQFNNREVIVYMDDNKKPPIGQGLNKPAEVTLLNIKCVDKKTGHQCTEGPGIEKYKEMLRKKAEEQGAEFVSFDPVKGEWKFRVKHFSRYKLQNEEETDGDV